MTNFRFFNANNSLLLALRILEKRDRKLLIVVILVQLFLAVLDLAGVLAIGLVGSLAVTGLSSKGPGNRVLSILNLMGLGESSLQTQVACLGIAAGTLLISKTLLTLFFSKRVIFFLSRRGAAISANLIRRYFSRPITSLRIRSSQESIYALTGGVNSVMVGIIGAWMTLITDVTLLVTLGIGLFVIDFWTSMMTLSIFALVAYALHSFMHKKIQKLGNLQAFLSIRSNEQIEQAIHSYRELLVRNRRGYYADQIAKSRFALADSTAEINFMQSLNKYFLEIAMVTTSILLAGYQFSTQTASRAIAVVAIFLAASARIMPAVLRVQVGLLSIKANIGMAKPTVELIQEVRSLLPVEDDIESISRTYPGFTSSVELENIGFSYDGVHSVLKDIKIVINPGDFIGIAGESGAGKTTLVDVILGAIEPNVGEVLVSKVSPLKAYSKWPGAVSYIPQDITIINGSIRENICLGYPVSWISDEECWDALTIARLDDTVRSLPKELDTQVGDRGTRLSGGQRQRLGIARALITRPKLLILDEATSSLDGVTESEISESLRKLRGEITLIVIAHRLSTIQDADQIYFMENGRIIDYGNFKDLCSRLPAFSRQAQAMGL